VLRLMAAVIHSLWEKGDKNPLILPANIPIDDQRVQFERKRQTNTQLGSISSQSCSLKNFAKIVKLGKA